MPSFAIEAISSFVKEKSNIFIFSFNRLGVTVFGMIAIPCCNWNISMEKKLNFISVDKRIDVLVNSILAI